MTISIGLLGASGIAPRAIIEPSSRRDDVVVAAVAARDARRAEQYARHHGITRSYGRYDHVLTDPDIDLVYIGLPPSEHSRWAIAALEAGKHVISEKPIAMTAAEARAVADAAIRADRRVIEAFHDMYHPLWARVVEITTRLGDTIRVEGDFLADNPYQANTVRHEPRLGGGALMDLGCYPVHWIRSLVGEEPEVVSVDWKPNPSGADLDIDAELRFPSGTTARIRADMAHEYVCQLRVRGSRGQLTVDNLVFPSQGHSIRWALDGVRRTETVTGGETYDHQLDAVAVALSEGTALPTGPADFVRNMEVIDAIRASGGIGRPTGKTTR